MYKYRPDIDGLRALAVIAVVLFHAFPQILSGGFIGVDIFFVISGYLISTIIFKGFETSSFSFIDFYSRRVKRIFPSLIIILLFCLVLGWFILLPYEYKQLAVHIFSSSIFISNFTFAFESGYFDNSAETKPLLHLWSLAVEEQFYILYPLIFYVINKFVPKLILVSLILLFFGSFIFNIYAPTPAKYYLSQDRFWEIISGGIIAYFQRHLFSYSLVYKYLNLSNLQKKRVQDIFSFIGILILIYGFIKISKNVSFPGFWALIPVLGSVFLIVAGPLAYFNRSILSNKILVWFGLISYPLYLWHWPLLSFARIIESNTPSSIIKIIAVSVSIAFAWLTHRFIERSIKIKNGLVVFTLLILMGSIGIIGLNIKKNEGYKNRESIRLYANNKNELIRTPASNLECIKYIGGSENFIFPYCKFDNANSESTIAVIGDSHAHVAYTGISELAKSKKINSILLANSGCPPLYGKPIGANQAERDICEKQTSKIIQILISKPDIKKIFIINRGPRYWTGFEPSMHSNYDKARDIISIDDFSDGTQKTINILSQAGKKIFYITENPELKYEIEACNRRPFRITNYDCRIEKHDLMRRQYDYKKIISKLLNVNIIDGAALFCQEDKCIVFDTEGVLLYADDDHLSINGSKFLAHKTLIDFVE